MKAQYQKQNQQGFSILEVVITLLIFGVVLVLYQAALNTVFVTREARHQETALRIATVKLEELRAAGYSMLPVSGGFTVPELNALPSGSAQLSVSDVDATMKHVAVSVQWVESHSTVTRNVSLDTLIVNTGGL